MDELLQELSAGGSTFLVFVLIVSTMRQLTVAVVVAAVIGLNIAEFFGSLAIFCFFKLFLLLLSTNTFLLILISSIMGEATPFF